MDLDRVRAEADRLRAEADRRVAEIRSQQYLTEDGRRRLMAAAIKPYADKLEALRKSTVDQLASERSNIERRVWANPGGADIIGWRDSLARAAALDNADDATAVFHRAVRSGDDQLARAIALDGRWRGLTAGYETEHTEWAAAVRALADHDRTAGSANFRMALGMLTSPPQPVELGQLSPADVDRLAASVEA
jgi:hypothetical protein